MGISPVQKGQKLTAQAWNQLATTVNNITSGTMRGAASGRTVPCTIKNHTSVSVPAGNVLTVYLTGCVRLAQYTPDEARAAWMNNGFQLDGYAALPSNSGTIGVPALLIDGIDEGGIGRALVYGLCAGYVTVSGSSAPDLVTFRASSGIFAEPSSGETGDWRVIASSAVSNSQVFAYLVPLGGGGGGNYPTGQAVTDVSNKYYQTDLSWSQSGHNGTVVTSESTYAITAVDENQGGVGITFVSDVYCDEYGVMYVEKKKLLLSKTNGTSAILTLSKTVVDTQPSGVTLPACDLNTTKAQFLRPESV